MEKNNSPEKDGVHWITGQELREIYADDLSLDKYDEIRKRSPPASAKILPEKPCDICLLNDLAANDYEKLKAHDAEIAEIAAAEVRKDERGKVLDELTDEIPNIERSYMGEQIDTYIETKDLKSTIKDLRTPTTTPVKEQKS